MVTYSATTCRNRLYFILTIKTVTSAQKTTKRNDHNEKAEIGVAAETSEKKTWNERNNAVNWLFFLTPWVYISVGIFHVNSLLCRRLFMILAAPRLACSAGVLLVRANAKSSRSFVRLAIFDLQLEWAVGVGGGEGRNFHSPTPTLLLTFDRRPFPWAPPWYKFFFSSAFRCH